MLDMIETWPKSPDVPMANRFVGTDCLRAQIHDNRSRDIWASRSPMTEAALEKLRVAPPYLKFFRSATTLDQLWFTHSPGQPPRTPLICKLFGNEEFVLVSRARASEPMRGGEFVRFTTDFHAILGYDANRLINYLVSPNGDYFFETMGCLAAPPRQDAPKIKSLPSGYRLMTMKTVAPTMFRIGEASQILFHLQTMQSFHGPAMPYGGLLV